VPPLSSNDSSLSNPTTDASSEDTYLYYKVLLHFTGKREQQPTVSLSIFMGAFPLTGDRLTLYNIIISWILII
jgi:hypothetical protein